MVNEQTARLYAALLVALSIDANMVCQILLVREWTGVWLTLAVLIAGAWCLFVEKCGVR